VRQCIAGLERPQERLRLALLRAVEDSTALVRVRVRHRHHLAVSAETTLVDRGVSDLADPLGVHGAELLCDLADARGTIEARRVGRLELAIHEIGELLGDVVRELVDAVLVVGHADLLLVILAEDHAVVDVGIRLNDARFPDEVRRDARHTAMLDREDGRPVVETIVARLDPPRPDVDGSSDDSMLVERPKRILDDTNMISSHASRRP
jgi:hypothetical protein